MSRLLKRGRDGPDSGNNEGIGVCPVKVDLWINEAKINM